MAVETTGTTTGYARPNGGQFGGRTKEIGPTVPRWRLGAELCRLRKGADVPEAAIAEKLACSVSKIAKIEAGYVGVGRAELLFMLDTYGADTQTREALLDLGKLGKQRGWWSRFGKLPLQFSNFLGLETAATAVQVYEPLMIYGLLQTDAYARALLEATWSPRDPEVDRQMAIRQERKARVLDSDPPDITVILGEGALRQVVGSTDIMREQLAHLLATTYGPITLRVLPYSAPSFAGALGAFSIFEFPESLHSPVIYVESQAGNLYMETPDEIKRCSLAFNQLATAALNPSESAELIKAVASEMAER